MQHPHSTKNLVSYVIRWLKRELVKVIDETPPGDKRMLKKLRGILRKIRHYNNRSIAVLKSALTVDELQSRMVRRSKEGIFVQQLIRSRKMNIGAKALALKYYSQIHQLLEDPRNFHSWHQQ